MRLLEAEGVLVRGEIRPFGVEPEWCDAEVLRRLRRRTLAALRRAVAPVDAAALGRFLPAWHGIGAGGGGPHRLLEAIAQLEGLVVPWSQLDRVLLPARVAGYRGEDLDLLAASGTVVWVGRGAAGPKDGRIALYRRESVAELCDPPERDRPEGPLHRALLGHLERRGACFLMELAQAAETADRGAGRAGFEAALWDLVWAGAITNDTFAPLRALGAAAARPGSRRAGGHRRRALVAGGGPGRARSRRPAACWPGPGCCLAATGSSAARRWRRRDCPAGFGPLYRVLKEMEDAGQVRRGWFVDGLSGAQFALAGALDRLRAARWEEVPVEGFGADDVVVLAAADPANAYGALVPWPERGGGAAPRRVAGAWVVLVAGRPVAYLNPAGRHLVTFPEAMTEQGGELALALDALRRLPLQGRRRLCLHQVDGVPALQSPLRAAILAAGFVADYEALVPMPWGPVRSGCAK